MRIFRWLILGATLLLTTACSQPASQQVPPPAQNPIVSSGGVVQAPTVNTDVARLFPGTNWSQSNHFDDGTREGNEWWVREGDRIAVGNQKGRYAVWHLTADGLYRRDPLGGAEAPFLRFLPATPADNLAWEQKSSGGETVRFLLRRVQTRCGDGREAKAVKKTPCWELQSLNRGRIMRFYFEEGAGIVSASLLWPARPADSYHKEQWGSAPTEAPPATMGQWLATAENFSPEKVAPTQPLTPMQFQTAATQLIQQNAHAVDLGGPKPAYLAAPLNQPSTAKALLIADERGDWWQRLDADGYSLRPAPCTYQAVPTPFPHLLEVCGQPAKPPAENRKSMTVRGWRQQEDGTLDLLTWPGTVAVEYEKSGLHITVEPSGLVRVVAAMYHDPMGHLETTLYALNRDVNASQREHKIELPPDHTYPKDPSALMEAVFFARLENLHAELPLFFTDPTEAGRLIRTDLGAVSHMSLDKALFGQVTRVQAPKDYEPSATVTAPTQPRAGEPVGFVVELGGCCGASGAMWGTVTFGRTPTGDWKIVQFEPTHLEVGAKVTPIPKTP